MKWSQPRTSEDAAHLLTSHQGPPLAQLGVPSPLALENVVKYQGMAPQLEHQIVHLKRKGAFPWTYAADKSNALCLTPAVAPQLRTVRLHGAGGLVAIAFFHGPSR